MSIILKKKTAASIDNPSAGKVALYIESDGSLQSKNESGVIGAIGVLTGEIKIWSTSSAPTGFLICNGASLLRVDYAALFAIIGTTYGSADGTHFNIPDLRGRVAVGQSTDTAFDTLGETGGEKEHTLITNEIPSHTHVVSTPDVGAGAVGAVLYSGNFGAGAARTVTSQATGNGLAHNNLQPYITLNYIIKT